MKWEEMTIVKKIICVVGWIGGFAYLILHGCEARDLFSTPDAIKFSLFSAFWVSVGIIQSNKKLAKWYYFIAEGYGLLTLLHIFF